MNEWMKDTYRYSDTVCSNLQKLGRPRLYVNAPRIWCSCLDFQSLPLAGARVMLIGYHWDHTCSEEWTTRRLCDHVTTPMQWVFVLNCSPGLTEMTVLAPHQIRTLILLTGCDFICNCPYQPPFVPTVAASVVPIALNGRFADKLAVSQVADWSSCGLVNS